MNTCELCDKPMPEHVGPGRPKRWCSSTCRMRVIRAESREAAAEQPISEVEAPADPPAVTQAPETSSYTASSIKVLSPAVAAARSVVAQIERLHALYPMVPIDFVRRLVEASAISGWPIEKVEDRYLAKVPGAESAPQEYKAAHLDLQLVASRGRGFIEMEEAA